VTGFVMGLGGGVLMKWPRGKRNRRIVGFNVKICVDLTDWGFNYYWQRTDKSIHLGCVYMTFYTEYHYEDRGR